MDLNVRGKNKEGCRSSHPSNYHCMDQGSCKFMCDVPLDPWNVMLVIICCITYFGNVGIQFQV